MVNSFIRRSDLDTEMTVVRNEFESGENNPQLRAATARCWRRAYQWHNYGNLPIGARSDIENVDIERLQAFYKLYYQPDNAVLIVAGKFDPDATLAADREVLRPDPEADAHAAAHLHGGAGAGRRAHGDAAPRRQLQVPRHDVPHGARRASGLRRHRRAGRRADDRARGPAVQGARRDQEGDRRGALGGGAARPRHADVLRADSRTATRSSRRATRCSRRSRTSAKEPITEAEVARVRAKAAKYFDDDHVQSADVRRRDLRSRSRSATGGSSSCSATAIATVTAGRRAARRARLPQALQRHGRRVHSRRQARSRAGAADGRRRGDGQGLQGRRRRVAGEAFDPSTANLDARTQRFTLPNGMKVALLPKKTRGEAVNFSAVAALRRREVGVRQGRPTAQLTGGDADARHDEEDAAGNRGRVRQAARARSASAATKTGASASGPDVPQGAARHAAPGRRGAARAGVPGARSSRR